MEPQNPPRSQSIAKEKNETGSLTIPDSKLHCKAVGKPLATSGSDNAPPRGDLPALRLPPPPAREPQHLWETPSAKGAGQRADGEVTEGGRGPAAQRGTRHPAPYTCGGRPNAHARRSPRVRLCHRRLSTPATRWCVCSEHTGTQAGHMCAVCAVRLTTSEQVM